MSESSEPAVARSSFLAAAGVTAPLGAGPRSGDDTAPGSAGPWAGRGTVLVAEDDEHLRSLMGRVLVRSGFEVLFATDGQEAMDLFADLSEDLCAAVLDVRMPHLGGVDACRAMRALRPGLPVLLSTGQGDGANLALRKEAGAFGVLLKPFRAADLREALARALDGKA